MQQEVQEAELKQMSDTTVWSCFSGIKALKNLPNLDYPATSAPLVHNRHPLAILKTAASADCTPDLASQEARGGNVMPAEHTFLKISNMKAALKLKK
jgi:hypothetical protein